MVIKREVQVFLRIFCLVLLLTFLASGLAQAALPSNSYKYPYYYYPKQYYPKQPITQVPTTKVPSQSTTKPTTSTTSQLKDLPAEEAKMLDLLNQERTSRGLKPLELDSRLRDAARAYSKEMVTNNFFSHTSAVDGSSPFDRIKRAGVSYKYAGENLAYNSSTQAAHTALMNSASHRANILNSNFTHVGIGIVKKGTSQIMATQEFIGI